MLIIFLIKNFVYFNVFLKKYCCNFFFILVDLRSIGVVNVFIIVDRLVLVLGNVYDGEIVG